jgi:hypothetical protein
MDSPMKKPNGKKKTKKGKRYEKPVSLFGMSFDEVMARIVKTRPTKAKKK